MARYHINIVRGSTTKPYPCEGYTVTEMPREGYYRENPHLIKMKEGDKVRFELESPDQVLTIPKNGRVAYVVDGQTGKTIARYPKGPKDKLKEQEKEGERSEKELRVLAEEEVAG